MLKDRERGTNIKSRTSQFWYAITNVLHIYRSLRNFWHFYGQWSQYHISVCQVNTATHAVNWLTQIIWFRSIPIQNMRLKFNHSESHCLIVWWFFITSLPLSSWHSSLSNVLLHVKCVLFFSPHLCKATNKLIDHW